MLFKVFDPNSVLFSKRPCKLSLLLLTANVVQVELPGRKRRRTTEQKVISLLFVHCIQVSVHCFCVAWCVDMDMYQLVQCNLIVGAITTSELQN